MRLKKWLKENVFYIYDWKKEIKKERKYEISNEKEAYLKKWYYHKTGLKLDLNNPKTFTDKQQYLKIYGVTPIKTYCTDKYLVRNFVKNTIGDKYLIPNIKINGKDFFKNANEISYDDLPNSFVIQCNHGAHMTHIVKNKKKLSRFQYYLLQKKINKELKINYAYCHGYEMHYRDIEPCIFVTKYLSDGQDLPDYKFFYFNGKLEYFSVDSNRFKNHKRTIYDNSLRIAPFQCEKYDPIDFKLNQSDVIKMIKISNELASYFDFVRVDLYCINGNIYFGELTFSSASGIALLTPNDSNKKMSSYIDLNKIGVSQNNPYEKI